MSTYTPIASQTLSSSAASITFSNIPQTYTDLVLVVAGTNASGLSGNGIRFNSDTSSNYSSTNLDGNGSSASSARHTNQTYIRAGISFTSQSISIINIQNYANTTTNKTVLARGGAAESYVRADVGLWRSTSAINSIFYFVDSGANFGAGTTFNLYGISSQNAITPKATGGDTVISDGTYWYHAYLSSGTFTPSQNLNCDLLIVAGGGSGGGQQGGGGGAGGVRAFTGISTTATPYTITVGAGGAASLPGGVGNSGSNTSALTYSVTGGGGGASNGSVTSAYNGKNGGSGGGGAINNTPFGTGNAGGYTPVEGYNGGAFTSASGGNGGAGGGGAGGVGGNIVTNAVGGNGGPGTSTYNSINFSTWLTATRRGVNGVVGGGGGGGMYQGGSGGSGGSGGGGAGTALETGTPVSSQNGIFNTGGGGGGGGQTVGSARGGSGGSGLVIIRYTV
jgi:hypothetical protein